VSDGGPDPSLGNSGDGSNLAYRKGLQDIKMVNCNPRFSSDFT